MQNKYKKVQDIYIELEKKSLLWSQKYETRLGLCEVEGHKHQAIIKILIKTNQPESLRLIEAMRNMSKRTQAMKGNPYIVECFSQQRTQNTFYAAFKKCKHNLQQITLDQYEILHMLASMIQLLKIFSQKGECHGNLKPSNVFPSKKLNSTICFKTTDFLSLQYSNNPDPEYVDPEMNDPSIASDIYALGKIALYKLKNKNCFFQDLLDKMVCSQKDRFQLYQLELEVEKLIENYEQKSLRNELNRKGITEEMLQKIIAKGLAENSQVHFKQIQEFEFSSVEPDFALWYRAQYFYLVSQEIRKCQTVEAHLINYLILSCLSESINYYQNCLRKTQNKALKSLALEEYNSLITYIEKVNLHCELYVQDLILKQGDVNFLQEYLATFQKPNQLLRQALSLVMEDIINKNLIKEFEYNEEMNKSEIGALNLIVYTNKMEDGINYDFKRLEEYIKSLQVVCI